MCIYDWSTTNDIKYICPETIMDYDKLFINCSFKNNNGKLMLI